MQAIEPSSGDYGLTEWLTIAAIIAVGAAFRFWRIDHPDSVV